MGEVINEINSAINTLKLKSSDIVIIDKIKNKKIFLDCLNHFVKSGDRRWWWEDFKQYSFTIDNLEFLFNHLTEYIPNLNENVWLMVEDNQNDFFPIYDCNPRIIGSIIGECFGFEYYIISKDKKWLICENHHARLIGSGNFEQN